MQWPPRWASWWGNRDRRAGQHQPRGRVSHASPAADGFAEHGSAGKALFTVQPEAPQCPCHSAYAQRRGHLAGSAPFTSCTVSK